MAGWADWAGLGGLVPDSLVESAGHSEVVQQMIAQGMSPEAARRAASAAYGKSGKYLALRLRPLVSVA